MKESILHYVWQYKLYPAHDLKTTDYEPVSIIDTGQHNYDAGPDFFNAKVKIGDTLWAGNIEIHTFSSDWNKHKHTGNNAYDSVILHVVEKADTEVYRTNGEKIPQLELKIPEHIRQTHKELLLQQKWIPYIDKINHIPPVFIQNWKAALLSERIKQKTEGIKQLLKTNHNNWEESFYITLARNFGFGTNGQAFEELAKSTPINILAKHKNSLFQIESLLFGQAGLLPEEARDDYSQKLTKEYNFLATKYNLQKKLDSSRWKLLRLRPVNFPHIRIAQFASLIYYSNKLFSKILDNQEIKYLQELFICDPSDYWKSHYTFDSEKSKQHLKKLGIQSINTIIINTIIPFLFAYASKTGNETLKEKAILLLEEIPAEKNNIINNWNNIGIKCDSAYDSQALLQLKKNYCNEKKCLRCRIGHKVLTINHQNL